jgi:hypothetical protein
MIPATGVESDIDSEVQSEVQSEAGGTKIGPDHGIREADNPLGIRRYNSVRHAMSAENEEKIDEIPERVTETRTEGYGRYATGGDKHGEAMALSLGPVDVNVDVYGTPQSQSQPRSMATARSMYNRKDNRSMARLPTNFTLLKADPSFDMWSLGMTLYCIAMGGHPLGCDGEGNLIDDKDLRIIADWPEDFKQQKLASIVEPHARNLISLLLSRDPGRRPSIDAVLAHPFMTGRVAARMADEAPDFDVFLSYRVASDAHLAELLYERLTWAGVRVWWDKRCLLPGEPWEQGFCRGLIKSGILVPLLSRQAINHPSLPSQSFSLLQEGSPCDNVLLEHRLSIELSERGLIEKTFPVFIGDLLVAGDKEQEKEQGQRDGEGQGGVGEAKEGVRDDEEAAAVVTEGDSTGSISSSIVRSRVVKQEYGVYSFRGADPCHPACAGDVVVTSVENKLRELLDQRDLGCPLFRPLTVSKVLQLVTSYQGVFLAGDLDTSLDEVVVLILKILDTVKYKTGARGSTNSMTSYLSVDSYKRPATIKKLSIKDLSSKLNNNLCGY